MKKMSVLNAAQHFGVSKEAIHNRVRRGSLQSVVEDGVKLVIIDETIPPKKRLQTEVKEHTLAKQNKELLEKIAILEDEIDNLKAQKEQIYKEKDKQLTEILVALELKGFVNPTIKEKVVTSNLILLKTYLKEQKISDKKSQKIKEKFKKRAKKDERIIVIDKKYYLDLDKYDYRDLL